LAEALAVAKSSSRLPVDTEGMRRHLYTQIRFDRLQDYEAWARVGGLLTESYLPTAQRSALFRAAATISGVVAVKESQDAAGRKGIAAAMVSPHGVREEDVFDPETYDYLGRRGRSGRERGVVECPVERQRRRQCTTCAVDGPGIRPASCATLPTSSDLRGTPGRWPVRRAPRPEGWRFWPVPHCSCGGTSWASCFPGRCHRERWSYRPSTGV
jgi:hypothetical protein